jgi:uncharacterized membrane-anchored protein
MGSAKEQTNVWNDRPASTEHIHSLIWNADISDFDPSARNPTTSLSSVQGNLKLRGLDGRIELSDFGQQLMQRKNK